MFMESTSLVSYSDEALFDLLKQGKREAFEELYHRYKRPLMAYALKKVNAYEAEDIMHDLWIKIWEQRAEITIHGLVVAYLFRSVRNRIIDFMARAEQARRYAGSVDDFAHTYEGGVHADHTLREKLFMEQITQLLARYNPKVQQIVALRMQGYKNEEIAGKLNLSEKTIRNQYSSVLKLLKSKFKYFSVFLIIGLFLILGAI